MALYHFRELIYSPILFYFGDAVATAQIKFISVTHLKKIIDGGEPVKLVDVRGSEEYAKEHIKGAMSIPLDSLDKAKQLFKGDDAIIVYCDSYVCSASTSAAKALAKMGFTNVRDYKGGLLEWKMNGFPTESL
ncbi:Rhodanese-related sulfurtransferase [Methanocella conradii HZ254]|uniref:Rhodanese-related sulfurtransferase n=1 Tax=Methanocella conradii (strain DSM 24694 / JCM 17849 / CGMCC 1.5162 / HZ254) TaxID=1041930 RepID=H8I4P5_METCZ|nr:Rhodanese-related sulfurtransferase [Methanocella conradii HZ254]